jgi:hypothetical protein
MVEPARSGFWSAIGWLSFPLVPVLAATSYQQISNPSGSDPRLWDVWQFVFLLGPLGGYAFLAGATVSLPDDPDRRGWRSLPSRRAIWIVVGPWIGFFTFWMGYYTIQAVDWTLARVVSPARLAVWRGSLSVSNAKVWLIYAVLIGWAYGWLIVAIAAGRRARQRGQLVRSIQRGLATALAFLGSLLGGFWAATSAFRSYFFDPRIPQILLIASVGLVISGCGNPTVGDIRRRELFHAMFMAWVLGLALIWRWLARDRKGARGNRMEE